MSRQEEVSVTGWRSFMLTDELGDIEPGTRQGLFQADTRFLSCCQLRMNGLRPTPLSSEQDGSERVRFYATNPDVGDLQAGSILLERRRWLNGHLSEWIQVSNFAMQPATLTLEIELGADFADVFELRNVPAAKLQPSHIASPAGWHHAFGYRTGEFACHTLARWSRRGRWTENVARFDLTLLPAESWHCQLRIDMCRGQHGEAGVYQPRTPQLRAEPAPGERERGRRTLAAATLPSALALVHERALSDLRSLRIELSTGERIVGAGLPYFMTLFGRDSLITGYQTLSFDPGISAGILRALARHQGTRDDPPTDQEPGKIPHEVREGEMAVRGDKRYPCYYGSVDATPLFLKLFTSYVTQTNDRALCDELWPAAEAALTWLDRYGDCDGDGFIEYKTRAVNGIENQGWKDSWDSVAFADGRLAAGPIALCEVQGYAYDALLGMAALYERRGQSQRATDLLQKAKLLQGRFDSAFWMPGAGTYALALDGDKRPVDAIASNAAHCLWSGIATAEHASGVVQRLTRRDTMSGWGLRTLSTGMVRYNPISYHNGSVWPHDTVLAAEGFIRYGHSRVARSLLTALIDAAPRFPNQRVPELFSGYPRRAGGRPIPYPDANAPQAWSAGAIVLAGALLKQMPASGLNTQQPRRQPPKPHRERKPLSR